MVIDTRQTVIRTHLRRFITLVIFTTLVIILLIGGGPGKIWLGMNKFSWALIVGLIYLILLILESMLELNYIFFSDEDEKIMLRYFSMSMLSKKKNTIQIPKNELGGYEILEFLWGREKKIVLLHRFKGKDARYPPVSLSGLSKEEFFSLTGCLDKWKLS